MKKATVLLIDCDSFQINDSQQRFLCEVGISTHTPPELQGQSFRGIIRSDNHDVFGLAVIIFQILFMGRHPFSGAFLSSGEMPLEKAIREYRFAYSSNALLSHIHMKQPPATLSLASLSPQVSNLFEQAFSKTLIRPKTQDWIGALTEMAKNLKKCSNNSSHFHFNSLSLCPWCDIEHKSGILLFNINISGLHQKVGVSNCVTIWAEIEAIQSPGSPPLLPNKSSLVIKPYTKPSNAVSPSIIYKNILISVVIIIACAVIEAANSLNLGMWYVISVIIVTILIIKYGSTWNNEISKLTKEKQETEKQWRQI